MAKNTMESLNKVYDEILGAGPEIQDESAEKATGHAVDGAYVDEDYSDDAGDGTDPRVPADEDEDTEDFVGAGSDEDDDLDGSDDIEEKDDDADEYEEIPDRLIQAGREANLSDDAIVELAESRPEALEALARAQEAAAAVRQTQTRPDTAQEDVPQKPQTGAAFEPLKLELSEDDEEEMGSRAVKLIKTLADQVNRLGSQVNEHNANLSSVQQQTQSERIRQIDSFFDTLSDDIPDLGKTGSLTQRQKQNRIFAFKSARNAMEAYGIQNDEEALAIGAKALKGQTTEAQVKERLIKDLDRNKKRFTSRGFSRKRSDKRKSVEERAMDAINRVLDGTGE
jgi:hypothetical protein